MKRASIAIAVLAALIGAACTSPEATRQRAGGSGGDVGNRKHVVRMHEGSEPYHGTPDRIGSYGESKDILQASRQADRLSRSREAGSEERGQVGSASPK